MLQYQLVPSARNWKISSLPSWGASDVPAGNLTPVNVGPPTTPDAGCLRSSTNVLPAVAVGIVNVQLTPLANVPVMKFELASEIVAVDPNVPSAVTFSVYPLIVGTVLKTTDPVPVLVVVPVPPLPTARVALKPAAVPVVF